VADVTDPAETWLTIGQAAAILQAHGVGRAEHTIRSWIRRGHLPARRGTYRGRTRLAVREADLIAAERDTTGRSRRVLASA
jgi:hypothetical protein